MAPSNNGIESADIMDAGLLIGFDDGRVALFSTELLLSVFSQAKEVIADEDDELPSTR